MVVCRSLTKSNQNLNSVIDVRISDREDNKFPKRRYFDTS